MFTTAERFYFLKIIIVLNLCLINLSDSAAKNLTVPLPYDNLKAEHPFVEYIFEHRVTKQEAISALVLINDSYFDAPQAPGCKAIPCTPKVMKYCLGSQFLNDHCLCEQWHAKEGLPFVPHTCYVGDEQTKASVGSCFSYNDIKECCCDRALARRWKFLSASSHLQSNTLSIWLPILMTTTLSTISFF